MKRSIKKAHCPANRLQVLSRPASLPVELEAHLHRRDHRLPPDIADQSDRAWADDWLHRSYLNFWARDH
jgi:hypothetical protein